MKTIPLPPGYRQVLEDSVRTTVAAVASLLSADLLGLPESYWAPVTTVVVMQSTLGAAWTVSLQRLAGTAIGAALGGIVATFFPPHLVVYGAAIFVAGIICALLRVQKSAYRFAGITLTIVLFVAHHNAGWVTAIHRFVEVSIGIAIGLLLTFLWPERAPSPIPIPAPPTAGS